MTSELARAYLQHYKRHTDPLIEAYLSQKIYEAKKYGAPNADLALRFSELARGGKRIRGALLYLGYELAGGRDRSIDKTSLFLELFHTGLLVHDDVMDQAEARRGLPTLHTQYVQGATSQYGVSMAINAGDLAFAYALEVLFRNPFPQKILQEVGTLFVTSFIHTVYGQILDVSSPLSTAALKDIVRIYRLKTAEYSGVLPLRIGAALAGSTNQKFLAALSSYGLSLGWLFQIQDEILGLFGDEKMTGKSVASDLHEKKPTLLMAHFLKHANERQQKTYERLIQKHRIAQKDVQIMKRMLVACGSYHFIEQLREKYFKKALAVIPFISLSKKYRDMLHSLLVYMKERTR